MATQSHPNYNAIEEAVEAHPEIRNAACLLGVVIVVIIQAVRWAWHYSPMVGG